MRPDLTDSEHASVLPQIDVAANTSAIIHGVGDSPSGTLIGSRKVYPRMRLNWRDIVETVLFTAIIFFLVRASAENFRVEGRSMEPTLSNGQFILINKAGYWRIDQEIIDTIFPGVSEPTGGSGTIYLFDPPQRGEVIVFQYPRNPDKAYIKRVIGIPGDTVEVEDGRVILNGTAVEESYLLDEPRYESPYQEVPSGYFYVLGDNRNNSSDSHVWGLVPEGLVVGRAWLSWWPPEELGFVPDAVLGGGHP